MRSNYAIVFVSDMQRSVAFYRDILGVPLKFESPEWTEFITEGATLALHHAKGPASAPIEVGRCQPGFSVPDLDAFHGRMVAHHVVCLQPPTALFGAKLAKYRDPDGLEFSVGEEQPVS